MAEQRLMAYLALLAKWNQHYNLTAVRDPQEMVVRHLLDSLSILPYVAGERLLDIGTGAGLPGIPLAIARPEMRVTLVDANGKKTRFVRQVLLELGMEWVTVRHQRIETLQCDIKFDRITARAFADLRQLYNLGRPLLEDNGQILAMKGASGTIEHEMTEKEAQQSETHRLQVPFLEGEQRHLVVIRKQ